MSSISRKLKQAKRNKKNIIPSNPGPAWIDKEGMHYIDAGTNPTEDDLKRMTEDYQRNIMRSPLWGLMVRQFGKKKAEEMLKEFQVKAG